VTQTIALAAGGTGGHLFPAEALAHELKARGYGIVLVTDARGARYAESFPADHRGAVSAGTTSVGGPAAKAVAAVSLARGLFTAAGLLRKHKVKGVVGFGGYPSLPAMTAASLLRIPYGVHEQNGVLGRSNRAVARNARFIACGFPELSHLPAGLEGRVRPVGNPVRAAVADAAGAPYPALEGAGPIRVLVFGGSQGARILADHAPTALSALAPQLVARLEIAHQAREEDVDRVTAAYAEAGAKAEVAPFFSDIAARMAAAHLVVARAGASTVTELATIGRPSVLVPLAIAMDDHQYGNAKALSSAGAAVILREEALSAPRLAAEIAGLLTAPERLAQMAAAARKVAPQNAAARLADLLEEALGAGRAAPSAPAAA